MTLSSTTNRIPLMRSAFRLVALLILAGWASSADAQTALHTLISPDVQPYGRFGESIASAGDVDGDGVPDIVVGAPSEGEDRPGQAHVFSGATGAALATLTSDEPQKRGDFGIGVAGSANGTRGVRVIVTAPRESAGDRAPQGGNLYLYEGASGSVEDDTDSPNESPNGRFGFSIESSPDADEDGIDDVVVGAPSEVVSDEPATTGRVYVLSGEDGDDLAELEPPQEGVRLFGFSAAGLPDVNGDGVPDVVVGAVGTSTSSQPRFAGVVYVYSGEDERFLLSVSSPNGVEDGRFGSAVAHVGDTNGDGISDFVVGAPGERTGAGNEAGRAYLFSGSNGSLLHTLDSPTGQSSGRFGESVTGSVDVNGDGTPDVLVGAPSEASSAGRVHAFSGADGSFLATLQSPRDAINGGFGTSLSIINDLDGDGTHDVLVGATGESAPDGTERAGAAYVFSGAPLVTGAVAGE
mgnify:CR=1 FL=1